MKKSILEGSFEDKGLVFDPRTKLLLLIIVSTVVLGGMCGNKLWFLLPCFSFLPFILFLTSKNIRTAFLYAILYIVSYLINKLLSPYLSGFLGFLVLGCAGIFTRFLPTVMLAMYVMSSTTVSEFTVAMQKLHISEKIVIPLSVMFRFFPTVGDEFSSITAAMKMRGISLGGNNANKMIEYLFIPLMICSVKIGDELSAAALTRGLGGTVKRTNVCKIGFHIQDVIIISLCIFSLGAIVFTKIGIL